ncbi:MAG: ketopantoate reductase family protein [Janthinobacterium lividum]
MKVAVLGVGAVGGHVAVRLLAAEVAEISLVVREAQRQAISERGLTLRMDESTLTVRPEHVVADAAQLPPQDLLIVGLKASSLPAAAETVQRLLATHGTVVFLINGVPWWWRHGFDTTPGALPLLDPDGALWQGVRPERVLGSVVMSSNEVQADGVIVNRGKNSYLFGEPDGSSSARLAEVIGLFKRAHIPAAASSDLRRDIWLKLMLNGAGNPISALTRLSTTQRLEVPEVAALMAALRHEILIVGQALGIDVHEADIEAAAAASPTLRIAARPSMLQDVLLGRPMEVAAILGQLQVFARQHALNTPVLDIVLPLLRGLDRAGRLGADA